MVRDLFETKNGLSVRAHEDPGLHLIGGSLPIPGTPVTIGTLYAGISETPARSDHVHGIAAIAFTAVTFNTGWSNYGSGTANAEYVKDITGFVTIRGTVVGANTRGTNVIGVLPIGNRPAAALLFSCISAVTGPGELSTRLDIASDGSITQVTYGIATAISYISINCTFYAG